MITDFLDKKISIRMDALLPIILFLCLDLIPRDWNAFRGFVIIVIIYLLFRQFFHKDYNEEEKRK